MNKITAFTIGTSHTINMGNYESLRIEASITVDPQDGELTEEKMGAAQAKLSELLMSTYQCQRRKDTDDEYNPRRRR